LSSTYIAGVGSFQITDRLSLVGRLGAHETRTKVSDNGFSFSFNPEVDLYAGASLDYEFANNWSVQLRYDRFDLDVASVGIKYSFGD